MNFSQFATYLEKLESTPKRLEITDILTDLIKDLPQSEVDLGIYLSLGLLKAPFENPKFNIADKMIIRVLEVAYNRKKDEVKKAYAKAGDLGNVAFELAPQKDAGKNSVEKVHKLLIEVALIEGAGSQDAKISKLADILKNLDKRSAKYLIRTVLGTTRLGFSELTVIDALAQLVSKDKEGAKIAKTEIEAKYASYPDIGYLAKQIKTKGLTGIKNVRIQTGVPILAQKCQRLSSPQAIIEKMERAWAEFKFDGTRVQLHLDKSKKMERDTKPKIFIKTFTRNQEEPTHQYPDIISAAAKQVDAQAAILDGEAIGYNKKTGKFLPLQETMQRKRKHGVAEAVKNIPLKYLVFDLLFLNGKSLMNKPLIERRKLLNKIIKPGGVIVIDSHLDTTDPKELAEFFDEAKKKALEGLIAKRPDSSYQAGARSFSWVKLKHADTSLLIDTTDCVILGYYHGKGARSKFGLGGFLAGIYDDKTHSYKTICKVGTGLTDEQWKYLKREADKIKIDRPPSNVKVDKNLSPNVWVKPKIVVELGADEITKSPNHTAGLALRFPRLIKFRDDKGPTDTTSLTEIKDIYKAKKGGSY